MNKEKKIKVMHVYKSFNVYNGLIEILTILAQNMNHKRYELGVCVYEYTDNVFGKKFESLGGKIYNLNIKPGIANKHKEFTELYKFFRETKPDIVQTHVLKANLYGTLAARMAKVPIVIATEMTLKDIAPTKVKRLRDKIIQPLTSRIIKKCDRFVVTSKFIKNEWDKNLNQNLFSIIYPPFNLEKYDEAIRLPRSAITSFGKRIGFVGRLSEEKCVDVLIDAMRIVVNSIPDAELVIVGTGIMEMQLKNQCDRLHLNNNVRFEGYKENSFTSLKEMDVFILPSRTEGCPIVILEAMAMGLPVIATHVGGNPELVVDRETGFLVSPNDSEQIAKKVIELVNNKELARHLGQNGRKRAFSQFHPLSFTEQLQIVYNQLLESNTKIQNE